MDNKYIHKPNKIEAIRFDGQYSKLNEIKQFCKPLKVKPTISANGIVRLTINEIVDVKMGEYIVKFNEDFEILKEEEFMKKYLPEKYIGEVSDGYHTFDELYYHRMILFSVICNTYKDKAWKSWKHSDGTMFDDYFIVGITTDEGNYTYHYHKDFWDMFKVRNLDFAPKWDGHEPKDITRLLSLVK